MLEQEIALFGKRMGIEGLVLPQDSPLAFDVEGMGRLYIEYAPSTSHTVDSHLLVYISRAVPSYDRELPRRILEMVHYKHVYEFPVQGGVRAGQAVLLTRFTSGTVTCAMLERAVLLLTRLMDSVLGEAA